MKSSPHFGVKCPCGAMVAVSIPGERFNDDPVAILWSLSSKDQNDIVDFYHAHEEHDGEREPCVMDIEPMAQA